MNITAHDAFKLGGYYERLQAMEHDARHILAKYGYANIADLKLAIVTCLEDATYTEEKPREPKAKGRAKAKRDTDAQAEVENARAEAAETANGQAEQADDPYPNVEASP